MGLGFVVVLRVLRVEVKGQRLRFRIGRAIRDTKAAGAKDPEMLQVCFLRVENAHPPQPGEFSLSGVPRLQTSISEPRETMVLDEGFRVQGVGCRV